MSDRINLGDVKLDAQQTIRKAWCDPSDGHRVVGVNVDYNITEYIYDDCCILEKIEFYYEEFAETTEITTIDNTLNILDCTSFIFNSKDDEIIYTVKYYSCSCAPAVTSTTPTNKTIQVELVCGDIAADVAEKTRAAISANTSASDNVTVSVVGNVITLTNKTKGLAADTRDVDTGFTFETTQQGTKTLVESLCFEYDENGNLVSIINSSGKNIFNLQSAFTNNTTKISNNGNNAQVTNNGELRTALATTQDELLHKIVDELRIMNLHLAEISDLETSKKDLDTRDDL